MRAVSLMFHDVLDPDALVGSACPGTPVTRYTLERAEFEAHLAALRRHLAGQPALVSDLPLMRANDAPVMLTFDDGGISAYAIVMDILERFGWKAHFFVTTDWIGRPQFMNPQQIRSLRARGHLIGSHSCSHPSRMAATHPDTVAKEWRDSVNRLADILGEPVCTASLPGGYYSRAVAEAAGEAGVRALFSSEPTGRTHLVGGCRVFGRYVIARGATPERTVQLIQGGYGPRMQAYMFWNMKKLLKVIAGGIYLRAQAVVVRRS